MKRAHGFTLVELLVTLTVAAILLAVGVPSFKNFIASQRVKSATTELVSAMLIARSEAVKRRGTVTVAPVSGSAWANGWVVTSGTIQLHAQEAISGIEVTGSAASIDFKQDGRPSSTATFDVVGTKTRACVKVDLTGIPSSTSKACS